MVHVIKILRSYANAIAEGRKTFEVRFNDRGYNSGDLVRFRVIDEDGFEWHLHPVANTTFRITYVHSGLGLQEGYVVFGIEKVEEGSEDGQKQMQIVIDIPKEFESHFELDRFSDSLGRIENDVKNSGALGRYERETITMIRKAIENGTPLPKGHGRIGDLSRAEKIVCDEFVDLQDGSEEWRNAVNDAVENILHRVHNLPAIVEADKKGAEE